MLSDRLLEEAVQAGYVGAGEFRIQPHRVQPASIDLTLGDTAHRLRSSFLPDKDPVESKLKELSQGVVSLYGGGGFLEVKVPYLIPLREELELPPWLRAKANPKSSTGRIDVFTRVITDHNYQFDEVRPGYRGGLYLEVVPLSFPIKVRAGNSLSQLRIVAGPSGRLSDDEIRATHEATPLLYDDNDAALPDPEVGNGLFLSVDLTGADDGIAGYRARSHTRLLDLTSEVPIDPRDFWEPVRSESGGRILLEPETFYLLLSKERVAIPPHLASEMVAYDPTSGELRTHYAGFFDPGFGASPTARHGSRAALEVRAHDVPFMVESGQSVCKLSFERMAEVPGSLYGVGGRSHYQGQESTLSKYFLGHRPA